jgi:hypothetical protein
MNNSKKILLIQYYRVKTNDYNYNINRQLEIDNCLLINCKNPLLDEIHLLTEELFELDFLPENLQSKIVQVVIGERLKYKIAFDYYNNNIPNTICILANSDIFTDTSLEILDHINFDNSVLAINRYEYDSDTKAPLLYGSEIAHNNPKFPNYSPVIWSQDAWIWKTKYMNFDGGDFHLGVCGCDNHITFLFKKAGFLVYNPSRLIFVNHYDRLSSSITENGIIKGVKSKIRDPAPFEWNDKMLHLINYDDVIDKYTVKAEMIKVYNKNCDFIYSLNQTKTLSKINHNLIKKSNQPPVYLWRPMNNSQKCIQIPEDNYSLRNFEYLFDNLVYLCIIDLFGKKCTKDDNKIAYVSKVNFTYLDANLNWNDCNFQINGIKEPNGNIIKRNYLPIPIPCRGCRLFVVDYVGKPEINVRLFGTSVFTHKIGDYAMTEFNNEWQKPVITEYQAYIQLIQGQRLPYNYFAFPWANLIDEKFRKTTNLMPMLKNYLKNPTGLAYFTVIQHIFYKKLFPLFKSLNIKYVFSPHCTNADIEIAMTFDIQLFGFQLYPIMKHTTDMMLLLPENRPFITSFVGQYDPKCYLTEIRPRIFDLFSEYDDCFISQRKSWHFQDIVYKKASATNADFENEYKQLLNNSVFSLCPSGSGPNSIRIWESMSFGTIPVILADGLVLPNIEDKSWEDYVIIWKEGEIDNLYEYLKTISMDEINKKSNACIELFYEYFNEDVFSRVLFEVMEKHTH